MTVFLRWALVETLFLVALAAGALSYNGDVHAAAAVSVASVLAVFLPASVYAGILAWRVRPPDGKRPRHASGAFPEGNDGGRRDGLAHIELAITLLPMLAMCGTAAGFLIAFSGGVDDVQQRVIGASSGIIATFVGIACAVCLMVEKHLIETS